jgi:hypothetical protein
MGFKRDGVEKERMLTDGSDDKGCKVPGFGLDHDNEVDDTTDTK